jgi:23S rRNA G2069 N7-methylase RlmK/C1962 C5-methylase RlmI
MVKESKERILRKHNLLLSVVSLFDEEDDTNLVVDVLGAYLAMLLSQQPKKSWSSKMREFKSTVLAAAPNIGKRLAK